MTAIRKLPTIYNHNDCRCAKTTGPYPNRTAVHYLFVQTIVIDLTQEADEQATGVLTLFLRILGIFVVFCAPPRFLEPERLLICNPHTKL